MAEDQPAQMSRTTEIVSHLLPQDGPVKYMAFSTAVGDKMLTTAIGLGNKRGFSEIGQRALAVASAHAGDKQELIMVPIAAATAKSRAKRHVERCLRAAPAGSLIFVCCEDSKTYDFASPGLHITVNGIDTGDPEVRQGARETWLARGKPSIELTDELRQQIDDDWARREDHR